MDNYYDIIDENKIEHSLSHSSDFTPGLGVARDRCTSYQMALVGMVAKNQK